MRLLLAAWLLGCGSARSTPSDPTAMHPSFITPEMAAEPEAAPSHRGAGGATELAEGPAIELVSPEPGSKTRGAVSFVLRTQPGDNGIAPNPDSLIVTYLHGRTYDITDSFRAHYDGARMELPPADLPRGDHLIEFYVEDMEGNGSSRLLDFKVK